MISKLKEPVNGLTHLAGLFLAIAGFCLLLIAAAEYGTKWHLIAFAVFGTSLILMYTSSSLYHLLPLSERGTRMLKRVDHMMIFILIAGTYTPICLVPLRGVWGWTLFGIVWGMAVLGFVIKLFWIHAPRWFSTAIYLAMGWVCVLAIYPMVEKLPIGALAWLAAGGLIYSVGAIIYGAKWPDPFPKVFGFHEIWHLFVLGGSFCHFWLMYSYVTYIG